jgi:hypothetical protein
MDMRVNSNNGPTGIRTNADGAGPRRQQFKDLMSALKAGDIEGAKKAYAAINANATKGAPVGSASRRDGPGPALPPAFEAIGKALANGDLAGAQKAAADMHHMHKPALPPRLPPLEERPAEEKTTNRAPGGAAAMGGRGTVVDLLA